MWNNSPETQRKIRRGWSEADRPTSLIGINCCFVIASALFLSGTVVFKPPDSWFATDGVPRDSFEITDRSRVLSLELKGIFTLR
jgi:hypothetical protein